MSLTVVSTPGAPKAIGPYSQAIVHGGLVYTAGQVALDPATMELVAGGVAEQADRALTNLAAVLAEAGSGLARVIKTTFLGRYVNYELGFDDATLQPDQAAIEFSQDIGTAKRLYNEGDIVRLEVNPEKINVFTAAGDSLMSGVRP